MKRIDDNPDPRFPDQPISAATEPWWVVKVLSRQEKALATDLHHAGVEYFLPMYRKVVRRRDNNKMRKTVLPLFPGYLCVAAPKENLTSVYSTHRVANIIEVRNQTRFVEELTSVYRAFGSGADVEPVGEMTDYRIGTRVMVLNGPLRGLQGIVARHGGEVKIVLTVECLGQAMVTVRAVDVRAVEERDPVKSVPVTGPSRPQFSREMAGGVLA